MKSLKKLWTFYEIQWIQNFTKHKKSRISSGRKTVWEISFLVYFLCRSSKLLFFLSLERSHFKCKGFQYLSTLILQEGLTINSKATAWYLLETTVLPLELFSFVCFELTSLGGDTDRDLRGLNGAGSIELHSHLMFHWKLKWKWDFFGFLRGHSFAVCLVFPLFLWFMQSAYTFGMFTRLRRLGAELNRHSKICNLIHYHYVTQPRIFYLKEKARHSKYRIYLW